MWRGMMAALERVGCLGDDQGYCFAGASNSHS